MRQQPRILRTAEISPKAIQYSMLSFSLVMISTLFGILLLPIALPLAWWYYRKFYATLEVVLTSRELQVSRGVLVRQEKSVPLEKVTDLALVQGPIMRRMGIKGLQVETAGQSSAPGGSLVKLIGILDTDGFRDDALDQRDKVTDSGAAETRAEPAPDDSTVALLAEIRDTIQRMDARLEEQANTSSGSKSL